MALRTKNKALLCKAENINHAHLRYLARDPPTQFVTRAVASSPDRISLLAPSICTMREPTRAPSLVPHLEVYVVFPYPTFVLRTLWRQPLYSIATAVLPYLSSRRVRDC